MNCFYCEKEILEGEHTIYPLDRPYVNLHMHRVCSRATDEKFIEENMNRILEYIGDSTDSKLNSKIKRK